MPPPPLRVAARVALTVAVAEVAAAAIVAVDEAVSMAQQRWCGALHEAVQDVQYVAENTCRHLRALDRAAHDFRASTRATMVSALDRIALWYGTVSPHRDEMVVEPARRSPHEAFTSQRCCEQAHGATIHDLEMVEPARQNPRGVYAASERSCEQERDAEISDRDVAELEALLRARD